MSVWSEVSRMPRGPPHSFFPSARESRRRFIPRPGPEDHVSGGPAPFVKSGPERMAPDVRKQSRRIPCELTGGVAPFAQESGRSARVDRKHFVQNVPKLRGTGVEVSSEAPLTPSRRHFSPAHHLKGADLQVTTTPEPAGRKSFGREVAQASCHLDGAAVSVSSPSSPSRRRLLSPEAHLSSGAVVSPKSNQRVAYSHRAVRVTDSVGKLLAWDHQHDAGPESSERVPYLRTEPRAASQRSPISPGSDEKSEVQPGQRGNVVQRAASAPGLVSPDQGQTPAQHQDTSRFADSYLGDPEGRCLLGVTRTADNEARAPSDSVTVSCGSKEEASLIPSGHRQGVEAPTTSQPHQMTAATSLHSTGSARDASFASASRSMGRESRAHLEMPAAGLARRRDLAGPFPSATADAEVRAALIRTALAKAVGLPATSERRDATPSKCAIAYAGVSSGGPRMPRMQSSVF